MDTAALKPSRGFLEALALIAVVGAAGFYVLGHRDADLEAGQRDFEARSRRWLAADKPFHAQLAKHDSAIAKVQRIAQTARTKLAQATAETATLKAQVTALGDQVPAPALALIANLQAQIVAAGTLQAATQRELEETRAERDSAYRRIAIADTVIRRGVEVVRCRMLLVLPCVSRTTAFVGGAAVGLLASQAVR